MSNQINHEKLNKKALVYKYDSAPADNLIFIKSVNRFTSTCGTCLQQIVIGATVKYFPAYKLSVHWKCKNL